MIKTAIPTLQGAIADDGAAATEYTLVSGENSAPEVNTVTIASGLSPAAVVGALRAYDVGRILAGNLSPDFLKAAELGAMQVFYGASGSIQDALNLIGLGILDSMANGCGCSGGGCGSGGCGGSCEPEGKDAASAGCGGSCGCGGH